MFDAIMFGSGPFIEKYYVGKVIPELRNFQSFLTIHYRGSYWELDVGYPGITKEEIDELHDGDLKMGITVLDGFLFFLFSIGKMPWSDTPYEPRLTKEPMDYRVDFPEGQGIPLVLFIVDSKTGVLKGMRVMGLGTQLSNKIHIICQGLEKQRPLSRADFNKAIGKIYSKYPSSEAMLKTVHPSDIFAIIT